MSVSDMVPQPSVHKIGLLTFATSFDNNSNAKWVWHCLWIPMLPQPALLHSSPCPSSPDRQSHPSSSTSDSPMVTLGIVQKNLNPVSPRSQSPVPVYRLGTIETGPDRFFLGGSTIATGSDRGFLGGPTMAGPVAFMIPVRSRWTYLWCALCTRGSGRVLSLVSILTPLTKPQMLCFHQDEHG